MFDRFKTLENLTPLQKIAQDAAPQTSGEVANFSNAISEKLSAAGASFSAIASQVSTGLDNVASKLKADVTEFGQKTFERLSPDQLISARKSYKGKGEKFSTSHMPSRKIQNSRVAQGKVQTLSFPPDMRKYYINFAFGEYERPNPYKESSFEPQLNIALPMPAQLLDPTGVKLNPTELGGMLGGAAENVAAIVQDLTGGGSPAPNMKDALKATGNQAVGAVYNTAYEVAGAIPGLDNVAGVAGQLFGAVPNPHVTVFFQGVDLRAHSFTYRFAPRNVNESITVQQIIREFKKRMLPNYKWGAANVLGYPQMVQISLEPNMEDVLYKFKQCMVSSVNVNYAPNGTPSFFAGTRHPTVIEFQVNFQELEIFTSQDYGGRNGDLMGSIGDALSSNRGERPLGQISDIQAP